MEKILAHCVTFVVLVIVSLVLGLLLAFPFMWFWNGAVCLALTIAKPIEYWTAYCLMVFISCFLGSKQ